MKNTTSSAIASLVITAVMLAACGDDPEQLTGRGTGPGDGTGATPSPENPGDKPVDPAQCTSRSYATFDKSSLTAKRVVANVGTDRGRVKPFEALQTEYTRVLGAAPASLAGAAATFGRAPARWFEEPEASAVGLQTAYAIAFDGCLTYTAQGAEYAAAPDATNASTVCSAMARKFWSKTPAPAEVSACVDVATKGTTAEPDARRRWAYACASVLTAAGFMTY